MQVNYCSTIGGADPKKVVRGILCRIFSADLANAINYTGTHNKIGYNSLAVNNVVIGNSTSHYFFFKFKSCDYM